MDAYLHHALLRRCRMGRRTDRRSMGDDFDRARDTALRADAGFAGCAGEALVLDDPAQCRNALHDHLSRCAGAADALHHLFRHRRCLPEKLWKSAGFTSNLEFSPFVAGMVALGMVLAAFSAEVWLGALNSIQKGQREAAAALGLTRLQAFRLRRIPAIDARGASRPWQ